MSLEEAMVAQDEAKASIDSLKSKCERQIWAAKEEADEKVARAVVEKDEATKSLEKGKANLRAVEESVRKKAYESAK